jgi:hypothetical protein
VKSISDNDFKAVLRLLAILSSTQGATTRERETARKATVLVRKLKRKV